VATAVPSSAGGLRPDHPSLTTCSGDAVLCTGQGFQMDVSRACVHTCSPHIAGPYIGAIVAVPIHIFFRWEFEEVNNDTRPRRMFSLRRPVVENQLPALNLRRRNSDEPSNLPSPTHDAINIVNIERASMVRESNRASMPRESAFAIPVARDLPESTSENVLPEVHVEMLESKTK